MLTNEKYCESDYQLSNHCYYAHQRASHSPWPAPNSAYKAVLSVASHYLFTATVPHATSHCSGLPFPSSFPPSAIPSRSLFVLLNPSTTTHRTHSSTSSLIYRAPRLRSIRFLFFFILLFSFVC
ncbi:hypothetical protein CLIB1423_10S01926 [[Candida] railenensis]|uniref:Uncharacterized protein n=1 Tax=[Candida] railenensis TaxID=45579 RepID=A0A9P0VZ71_9ASCO|nr:hypothetical protein CLIB1423_10S01926 [[Candida] railenensis]